MTGYSAREVGRLLDLSSSQVRWYMRAGLVRPDRGPRGAYRFSFQDLVFLRAAKSLLASAIPERRVRVALRRIREQIPDGSPLSAVHIGVDGDRILVSDGIHAWDPETGQIRFDFGGGTDDDKVSPHGRRVLADVEAAERAMTADDWSEMASELEDIASEEAREAYRRALELDPRHVEAHLGSGRLLEAAGFGEAAERHVRLALEIAPCSADAHFLLGSCLERAGRGREAIDSYQASLRLDVANAEACFRLARLHEQIGDTPSALLWLEAWRALSDETDPPVR